MVCFGVDLGGTTVKIGAFTKDGELLKKWEIPTRKENNGKYILDDICESLNAYLFKNGISDREVYGIGIGVPGAVTKKGVVLGCVNLGWGQTYIEKELSEKFHDVPVYAGNDANLAALGEQVRGGGAGYDDMVMVTLGTGVGGGIVLGGKIITGSNGAAGEIGHMPVIHPAGGERCSCGKDDCLELVASATGIVREAKRMLAEGKYETRLAGMEEFSAKDVLDLAKAGDTGAKYVAEVVSEILGTALANIASVVNPQIFVIGGGVSRTGQWFLDMVEEEYKKRAFAACRDAKFSLASLGNDAGIYGAAALCI